MKTNGEGGGGHPVPLLQHGGLGVRGRGCERSDETLLTGETASKVREAASAKVPNGTLVRVETDADGNAAYEAHMVKADGTPVTACVTEQFEVVSVVSR